MRFIPFGKTIHFHDRVLPGPLFWCFSAAYAAGFALQPGLEIDEGPPEAEPPPGTPFDLVNMTPKQRNAYCEWTLNNHDEDPALGRFYDQYMHMAEAYFLLVPKPDTDTTFVISSTISKLQPFASSQQLARTVSLYHWLAGGAGPSLKLEFSPCEPWLSRNDLNEALSTRHRKGLFLGPALAARICQELSKPESGSMPPSNLDKAQKWFDGEFYQRWPKGFLLHQPTARFPLLYLPAHPYTASQIRGRPRDFFRECWNFFDDPTQFEELVQLWARALEQAMTIKRSRKATKSKKPQQF